MPTHRKAYALWNSYASETDAGFQNTWSAYVFDSLAQRENWLATQTDMASRACSRREALKHAYSQFGRPSRREDLYLFNPVTDRQTIVRGPTT